MAETAAALWILAGIASAQIGTSAPSWLPAEATYEASFFPDARHDPAVQEPDAILGYRVGTRPMTHGEMERCLLAWKESKRMKLQEYARSHERRALYYAVVTSERNHQRMGAIREGIGRLSDPRKMGREEDARGIIAETPAIVWMAYSIHGDELSSTDAAVSVLHHLLAATDGETEKLLDELVVIIDPLMNPDGRDRYIRQLDEFGCYAPNLDLAAMQHSGRWPRGRGNHYYFDLNRDWILGVHPETRGRRRAIVEWKPQLLIDSHEMGGDDTYLFYPAREPFNPHVSPLLFKWWGVFAEDQATAFDRFGWSYYTREWADYWYAGYSDSWSSLLGAIAILYEQAGVGGGAIRQPSGSILTYRESVHHHVVSSMANLETMRKHRASALSDFHTQMRQTMGIEAGGPAERTFVIRPSANATRDRSFIENLMDQGIEVGRAGRKFSASSVSILREAAQTREFEEGTWVIATRQPAGRLAAAALDFDPRMSNEFLNEERRELEMNRRSKIYDITAWSLPMAYAVDGYWVEGRVEAEVRPLQLQAPAVGVVQSAERAYAYVVDGADDGSLRALSAMQQAGVRVRVAEKDFLSEGRTFQRGSLLIRVRENEGDLLKKLERIAGGTGVTVYAAKTGRSVDEGPDLGGGHFPLLERPRVAVASNAPVDVYGLGHVWQMLDAEFGVPVSLIDVAHGETDLRRYNVVVLPETTDGGEAYSGMMDELKSWVNGGGTLIAIGNAVGPLIEPEKGISAVRSRTAVLGELEQYGWAVKQERSAGRTPVDAEAVWNGAGAAATSVPVSGAEAEEDKEDDEASERLDEWRRVFSPAGVIVRGEMDANHWLTFGCVDGRRSAGKDGIGARGELPVFFSGEQVLMSKHPVKTAVRLSSAERLRLSGLLWSEAAARMGDSAYATVEPVGHGQVILFACDPNFRGYYHGSRRLLMNAILLGPGCGATTAAPGP